MSPIDSANPYRVQGPVTSVAELAKSKPGMVIAATAEQKAELALFEQQTQARQAASDSQAAANPSKIFAQIIVDGKVFGTIHDSGSAGTQYAMSGLSEGDAGLDLAKTRLREILQAVKGSHAIYSGFAPLAGPAPAVIDESRLPKVTARSLADMAQDMSWALTRARIEADEAAKDKT